MVTRYILAELLKIFGLALAAVTLLAIMFGMAKEALQQGLGPVAIIQLIPYVLPNALFFALPVTILFAVCSVYGRMSAANEVVAIKSLGVSPMPIIWPALVLGFLLSLMTVWLNDLAVSWGRQGISRVIIQSAEEITIGMLRSQRSFSTNRFSINVQDVDGRRLIRPTLDIYGSESSPPITLTAEEAELRSDFENNTLIIEFRNGTMDIQGKATLVFRDSFEHEIPLGEALRKGEAHGKPSNYALREIAVEVESQEQKIEQIGQSQAAQAAFEMITGDFDALTSGKWTTNQQTLSAAKHRLSRLQTEPWRRWANGFSCLCFVVVGVPLAIWGRYADVWTTFGLCFLPILFAYYPLLIFGLDRAKCGALPPYTVWLGNVLLFGVGYWLLQKVLRY